MKKTRCKAPEECLYRNTRTIYPDITSYVPVERSQVANPNSSSTERHTFYERAYRTLACGLVLEYPGQPESQHPTTFPAISSVSAPGGERFFVLRKTLCPGENKGVGGDFVKSKKASPQEKRPCLYFLEKTGSSSLNRNH